MLPLDKPVKLPEFMATAYEELGNAMADVAEKHNLSSDDMMRFLGTQFCSFLVANSQKEITAILHTTLPVRVGLLDAHDETEKQLELMQQLDENEAERIAGLFTKQRFSQAKIAWKWLAMFFATNKNPKQLGEK